jgi:hypothetical protein
MLGAFLVGFISLVFFIINGKFKNKSRHQRMMINAFLLIGSIFSVVFMLLQEKGIMIGKQSTFIGLGFISCFIGFIFRTIYRISRNKTKNGN